MSEETDLSTHVVACGLRYEAIGRRLKRLEYAVYLVILVIISDEPLTEIIKRILL